MPVKLQNWVIRASCSAAVSAIAVAVRVLSRSLSERFRLISQVDLTVLNVAAYIEATNCSEERNGGDLQPRLNVLSGPMPHVIRFRVMHATDPELQISSEV